jgi:hypothetical protein
VGASGEGERKMNDSSGFFRNVFMACALIALLFFYVEVLNINRNLKENRDSVDSLTSATLAQTEAIRESAFITVQPTPTAIEPERRGR